MSYENVFFIKLASIGTLILAASGYFFHTLDIIEFIVSVSCLWGLVYLQITRRI